MLAVGTGDMDAFRDLVLAHQRHAWSVAFRFLRDPAEAEDVVQEAFLKIFEAAPRYRPTASFRTYLYQVVSRLCIDRAEKKHPDYTDELPDLPDPAPSPAEALGLRQEAGEVRLALLALPPNQRMALVLKHYEGLSYTEIAQAMGTSAKAVEGLLGRARATLQARLAALKGD
ncbi:MAG: sigma-70 family RNA polymerase sigma factor [Deltaproteobacteria bacterium]|nr:sigma-70 family RNA polymerase sigma factor [Deltaproteobacteria bacterium]